MRPGEKRISCMLFDAKHDRLITGMNTPSPPPPPPRMRPDLLLNKLPWLKENKVTRLPQALKGRVLVTDSYSVNHLVSQAIIHSITFI